ncbi:MAG: hypothetical protein H5T81_04745 [Tetrasphaera sp.]|nr:hypothetical protein [Tetrasphaera sp.]
MPADAAAARFGTLHAGYESYYLRATDPAGGRGCWIRYTVRIAPDEEPSGSLWFTWFDREGPTATKQTTPGVAGAAGQDGPWLEVAGGRIESGRAIGEISCVADRPPVRWDLAFAGEPPLKHLGGSWRYTASLPRTKPVSIHPMACLSGTVGIGEREYAVHDWPGMVGHNWGTQHAERWIWLHGMRFDGYDDSTWLDVVLGRIQVGPVLMPWIASGAMSVEGERIRVGGIARVLGTHVRERPTGASLRLPGSSGSHIGVEVGAPSERFVGWEYASPDGRTHDVANCSIADIEVAVQRSRRPNLLLRATGTAAYELGMHEHDHGIAIQPFPDGPAR